jgi:FKBP-type peptidyl-prolyl cis-trans isomerase
MRSRINVLVVAALVLVMAVGCEEPKDVIPVAPPGFDLVRIPTTPQGDGAQALGETASVIAAEKAKAAAPQIVANAPPTPLGQPSKADNGLIYETLQEGTGPACKSGDTVDMHYTGTFTDGKKFDSSLDRNAPLSFTLGSAMVIRGWDEGIPGMKVGEKRKLTIPSDLAYGPKGKNPIPPNTPLVFEVELIKIK